MRSRAARLALSVFSWIVLTAAAASILQSQQEINDRRAALRTFDERARDAQRTLADVRAGQQAYVAAGQGIDFWMPKVNAMTAEAAQLVDRLRETAVSAAARASLMEAGATVTEFANIDRRAREYVTSNLQLMAGDVVFTEGGQTANEAVRQIEAARVAEQQDLDAWEAAKQRRQASILGAAAGFAVLLTALFAFGPSPSGDFATTDKAITPAPIRRADSNIGVGEDLPRTSVPALKIAAELCTELARVNDSADLMAILGRAANVMDASGLVVWMGSTAGADLQPVLAHGYTPQVLARMPAVTRTANNAAAAAYRTGALQIVLARPGQSNGALVAPLLTPDGCIGALTAEIRSGGETADATQALAAIFAAQLATVLGSSAVPIAAAADSRIASA
jgi:hypothetical protein